MIFVSHDRYFIDRLATRVLEVEGGKVTSHEGNYEDYLRWKGIADSSLLVESRRESEGAGSCCREAITGRNARTPRRFGARDRPRRLNPIKQKQMEERCAFLEEEIPRIEAAIAHTEEQLGVYVSAAETERLSALAEDLRDTADCAHRRVGRADDSIR